MVSQRPLSSHLDDERYLNVSILCRGMLRCRQRIGTTSFATALGAINPGSALAADLRVRSPLPARFGSEAFNHLVLSRLLHTLYYHDHPTLAQLLQDRPPERRYYQMIHPLHLLALFAARQEELISQRPELKREFQLLNSEDVLGLVIDDLIDQPSLPATFDGLRFDIDRNTCLWTLLLLHCCPEHYDQQITPIRTLGDLGRALKAMPVCCKAVIGADFATE
jgi:hypothetical protein